MPITTIFIDLDGTLYPEKSGLWQAIKNRIDLYLQEKMGFPHAEALAIRQRYLDRYGTTLRGLQAEYQVDSQDYLDFVHDLPLENFISPDPALSRLLHEFEQPLWVFTNSDRKHADRVLRILGIENTFQGIIDINRLSFLCKPDPAAYQRALEIVGSLSASEALLVDDSWVNILAASRIGFQTVLVADEPPPEASSPVIATIHQLPQVFARLPDLEVVKQAADGQ
jgi:putative hydrolase of the HAD superfamily